MHKDSKYSCVHRSFIIQDNHVDFCSVLYLHGSNRGALELSFRQFLALVTCSLALSTILGDPGAASRDDGIFMGESLQQERESPWALTLTDPVPEAFEFSPSDWPEKYFSGQSAKRNSRATLMSSYTRLFSSSIAVVAWPVQREHF